MADVKLRIGQIKFGSLTQSSGVFVGQSVQSGWRGTAKTNAGYGKITGMGNHHVISSSINDADFIDTIRVQRAQTKWSGHYNEEPRT